MDKLKMQTPDLTDKNIEQIGSLFPNVITESRDEDGNVKKAVDFDLLKQILSKELVEDDNERYRLDWPGKKASLLKANTPITKTLRPCREESVNFDTTENLYIEGDNFEVLKILQESYLNKVKMIYIDPPYNTGNDFIYKDNFKKTKEEYEDEIGATDEDGGKLFKNTDSNGRYHSDWLSMMYERLIVVRDLLRDDGVIFISIDDNEVHNLRKICDEVFGEENFLAIFVWQKKTQPSFLSKEVAKVTENLLCFKKTHSPISLKGGFVNIDRTGELINIGNPVGERILKKEAVEIENGNFTGVLSIGEYGYGVLVVNLLEDIEVINGIPLSDVRIRGRIIQSQITLDEEIAKGAKIFIKSTKTLRPTIKKYRQEAGIKPPISLLSKYVNSVIPSNTDASNEMKALFRGINIMDYPKPSNLIKYIVDAVCYNTKNVIILDFFSGSATTAHAVMQLNAEDGGNRKFIMVQLPEKTDEKSEAYKAGYETIAEIGKERIRRAGKKIMDEMLSKKDVQKKGDMEQLSFLDEENSTQMKEHNKELDIGFRVYKTDTTNMKDVFYHPSELKQEQMNFLETNIKEDRTPEDLLTQVILDLGLELTLPIETKNISGNTVFIVQTNALVACFDDDIDFGIVDKIAEMKPFKVVFKDSSFKYDKDRINVEERFKRLSPETRVTVI